MKALIVGGAGFVGHHLYRHLSEDLHWDVTVTKLPQERFAPAERCFDLDILDTGAVLTALQSQAPDVVFHLAAQSSVALSWKNPDLTVDINIKGTLHLLEAVRQCQGPLRVLLIGSGEEYGFVRPEDIPVSEQAPLRPGNPYAMTKAAQNMVGQIYARAYDLDIVMVRAFNHIGPGQLPQFVMSDFCRQVARMEAGLAPAVLRVGNLSARRDFTDVRDVVRAYALLVQSGRAGTLYNVGSGQAYSIRQVLDAVLSQSSIPVRVEQDPQRMRPSDVPLLQANVQRLVQDTGWAAAIGLEKSAADTLTYWRDKTERE